MIINRIEPQGYCQGVTNALRIINEALESNNNIYSLGSIIHNDYVIMERFFCAFSIAVFISECFCQ